MSTSHKPKHAKIEKDSFLVALTNKLYQFISKEEKSLKYIQEHAELIEYGKAAKLRDIRMSQPAPNLQEELAILKNQEKYKH